MYEGFMISNIELIAYAYPLLSHSLSFRRRICQSPPMWHRLLGVVNKPLAGPV